MDTQTEETEQLELIENQAVQTEMEVTQEATSVGNEEDVPFHGWEDITPRRRSTRIMNRLLKGEEEALIGILFFLLPPLYYKLKLFFVPSKDKA